MDAKPDLEALKRDIIEARGYWHPFHEGLLRLNPDFLKAYLDFQSAPWKSGHLEPKVREFIYIAVDGAVTHLYEKGLRRHIENALALGATQQEVLQVVLLTCSASGHQTHELGMSVLMEELERLDPQAAKPEGLSDDQKRMKQRFIDSVGYWPECGDALLKVAPHFADGFLGYGATAWSAGSLAPKVKEFVGLAVCASPASLYETGVRNHIRRALAHGATSAEISEVLQLASAIAIHTCTYGVPALVDAVAAHAAGKP